MKNIFRKNIIKSLNFNNIYNYNYIHLKRTKGIYLEPKLTELQEDPEMKNSNLMINSLFKYTSEPIKFLRYKEKNVMSVMQKHFQHFEFPMDNQHNQEYLIRWEGNAVRIGRLMEIFDVLAGEISYRYCQQGSYDKATIVTACVDNIRFFEKIDTVNKIVIQAYPSFIGNSSIEIQIVLYQESDQDTQNLILKARTAFLMVARDSKDRSKAYKLPVEDKLDEKLNQQGLFRQQKRKEARSNSFMVKSPNQQQSDELHKFYLNKSQFYNGNSVDIQKTKLSKIQPMHFQDRNIHGNIFGGYLIREAIELGFLSGIMYAKGNQAEIKYIDDIQFIKPVNIGDVLKFESRVCYVQGKYAFILVECYRMGFDNIKIEKTNEFHLIFDLGAKQKPVHPISYDNGIRYLQGKQYMEFHNIKKHI